MATTFHHRYMFDLCSCMHVVCDFQTLFIVQVFNGNTDVANSVGATWRQQQYSATTSAYVGESFLVADYKVRWFSEFSNVVLF